MAEFYFKEIDCSSYREMSCAVHSLLKSKLSEKLNTSEDEIIIEKTELGKPFIKGRSDVFVSLSHSHGVVMCGIAGTEIGVDIELVKKRRKSIESRVLNVGEISLIDNAEDSDLAFFTLWTLKESYLKAIGTGFADNAKEIEFFSLSDPIKSNKPCYDFEVGIYGSFVYAVCVKKCD